MLVLLNTYATVLAHYTAYRMQKGNTLLFLGKTLSAHILDTLGEMVDAMPLPFETPYHFAKRLHGFPGYPYWRYTTTITRLTKRGLIKKTQREGQEFLELTKKGILEILATKMLCDTKKPWDGKWRVAIFDIPEVAHHIRDEIRRFLKKSGFIKLQASVYITPYTLTKEAVEYLNGSGLKKYIRFLRVDECDDDHDLRGHFHV